MLRFFGVELEPVELRDALDDQCDRRTEISLDDLRGDPGVFDCVVQQGRSHGLGVEAQVGHDPGHGDGVGDVGLPRAPQLAGMCNCRRLGRPNDERSVISRVPSQVRGNHRGEQLRLVSGQRGAGEPFVDCFGRPLGGGWCGQRHTYTVPA